MVTLAIDQFQNDPLAALRQAESGETVVILRDNVPIAEIKPTASAPPSHLSPPPLRPFGLAKGQFTVPDDFDAPLPDDELRLFEGT